MAFDQLKAHILNSNGWFFPEGAAITSPGVGVVSQANWPDANEETFDARFVGDIEDWSFKKNVESEEVRKHVEGVLTRKQIVDTFQSGDFEFTTNSLMRIAMQILMGSAVELTEAVGNFKPLEAFAPEGLWIARKYNQFRQPIFLMNCWCKVDVQEIGGGGNKIAKPKFTVKLLDAPDNYMFFGDPALLEA